MTSSTCPMCRRPTNKCGGHGVARVELTGDAVAGKVRFRVVFFDGATFCAALPAGEAASLAIDLARAASEAGAPNA